MHYIFYTKCFSYDVILLSISQIDTFLTKFLGVLQIIQYLTWTTTKLLAIKINDLVLWNGARPAPFHSIISLVFIALSCIFDTFCPPIWPLFCTKQKTGKRLKSCTLYDQDTVSVLAIPENFFVPSSLHSTWWKLFQRCVQLEPSPSST